MNIEKLFESFIQHGRFLKSWSPRTVETYRQAFSSFQTASREPGDSNPTGATVTERCVLTKARLEAWVVLMRQRNLSPGACNVYIRSINSFLTWLSDEGHTPQRLRLKLLQGPKKTFTPFSDAHVRAMLSHKPKSFYELRTWTLINTLLDTGCRITELLTLRVDSVDLENLTLKVMGKGSKERSVPFSLELRKALFRYLQQRGKRIRGEYVFGTTSGVPMRYRNVYRDILELCRVAGVNGPRISPHTFRHYFAVSYIRNGGDVYRLSRILGHTSVKTTEIYLRTMGVEMVGEQHSKLSPLARLA